MAKIKNINGTSENTSVCKCGSWIKHWDKFSTSPRPTYCIISDCLEKDLVGAHVQKSDPNDNKWYIAPICQKHNTQKNEEFEIATYSWLVPANKSETCDKK